VMLPSRLQNGLAPSSPTGCVSSELACELGWLVLGLFAAAMRAQESGHRGLADLGELLFHFAGQMYTAKASQMLSCRKQHRREPFCTHAIQAFPHHQDHLQGGLAVGTPASAAPLLALQRGGMEQSGQAKAQQARDLLHLGEQITFSVRLAFW
jgi:hypothetical protein